MKLKSITLFLLAAALLSSCSKTEPSAADNTPGRPAVQSIKDLEKLESTTLYTGRATIKSIDKIENDIEQPLAAPEMDYVIRFEEPVKFAQALPESEDPTEQPISSVYTSVPDTHIYKQINGQQSEWIGPESLKAGDEIELTYFYPLTPVFWRWKLKC